jgi:hypothetical protein
MIIEVLDGLLVVITAFYALMTYKTVKAMQQQTEAISRPYITINAFSEPNGFILYLRIANTGRTGASKVRLSLDRDFYQFGKRDRPSLREATIFQQPIDQLPPGAEMIFGLAEHFVVLGSDADSLVTPPVFSINATYSYGKNNVSETTTIDLRPYKGSMSPPSAIADELKRIRNQLERIAS